MGWHLSSCGAVRERYGESRWLALPLGELFPTPLGDASLEASSIRPLSGPRMLPESRCGSQSGYTLGQYRGQRTEAYSPKLHTNEAHAHTMYRALENTPHTNPHSFLVNIFSSWIVGAHNAHRDPGFTPTWTSLIFPQAPVGGPGFIPLHALTGGCLKKRKKKPDSRDHCLGPPLIPHNTQRLRLWVTDTGVYTHEHTGSISPLPFYCRPPRIRVSAKRREAAVRLKGSSGQQPSQAGRRLTVLV